MSRESSGFGFGFDLESVCRPGPLLVRCS